MAYTTIDDPGLYFNTKLYTGGNGSATTISGLSFQPDMVWCKGRSYTGVHAIMDDQRSGANGYGWLRSGSTDAENNTSGRGNVSSWTSDGFVLSADSWGAANYGTNTHVAWCWKESATAGFDIVTYTGDGSGRTLSHSLSAVPSMIIHKERGADGENWPVYTKTLDEGNYLMLSTTAASAASSTLFNDTAPTSSVFSVGADAGTNGDGKTYVAYLFAEKQGYSKFGSYVGNNNASGPFVYTGFKPAFILIKNTTTADQAWFIFDNKRDVAGNENNNYLIPSSSAAERGETGNGLDMLSNGFKLRSTGGFINDTGTFIYMAFASNPFVSSTGVPACAR